MRRGIEHEHVTRIQKETKSRDPRSRSKKQETPCFRVATKNREYGNKRRRGVVLLKGSKRRACSTHAGSASAAATATASWRCAIRAVVMPPIDASRVKVKVGRLGLDAVHTSRRGLGAKRGVRRAIRIGRRRRYHKVTTSRCGRARVSRRDGCGAVSGLEEAVFCDLRGGAVSWRHYVDAECALTNSL